MVGNKYFYKNFQKPNLESQVLEKTKEISEIKEEPKPTETLLISDGEALPETPKKSKGRKPKKTKKTTGE